MVSMTASFGCVEVPCEVIRRMFGGVGTWAALSKDLKKCNNGLYQDAFHTWRGRASEPVIAQLLKRMDNTTKALSLPAQAERIYRSLRADMQTIWQQDGHTMHDAVYHGTLTSLDYSNFCRRLETRDFSTYEIAQTILNVHTLRSLYNVIDLLLPSAPAEALIHPTLKQLDDPQSYYVSLRADLAKKDLARIETLVINAAAPRLPEEIADLGLTNLKVIKLDNVQVVPLLPASLAKFKDLKIIIAPRYHDEFDIEKSCENLAQLPPHIPFKIDNRTYLQDSVRKKIKYIRIRQGLQAILNRALAAPGEAILWVKKHLVMAIRKAIRTLRKRRAASRATDAAV